MTPEQVHEEVLRLEQRLENATTIAERLARIETRIDGLQWTVRGLYGLLIVAVFVNHFWK
jgi:uncharacterized protein Yka (UPF0111/DUF47 family)